MKLDQLLEGDVVPFGGSGSSDLGIDIPRGYDSFFTKGKEIWGVTPDKKQHRVSGTSMKN